MPTKEDLILWLPALHDLDPTVLPDMNTMKKVFHGLLYRKQCCNFMTLGDKNGCFLSGQQYRKQYGKSGP